MKKNYHKFNTNSGYFSMFYNHKIAPPSNKKTDFISIKMKIDYKY